MTRRGHKLQKDWLQSPHERHSALAVSVLVVTVSLLVTLACATWASAQSAPQRLSARSATYELVAVADGAGLKLYLDRFATNEPVRDAVIELLVGNTTVRAEANADGTYRAVVPGLAAPVRHLLVFSIRHASGDDLLEGEIDRTAGAGLVGAHGGATGSFWEALLSPKTLMLALLLGLAGGIALGHRYLPARDPR